MNNLAMACLSFQVETPGSQIQLFPAHDFRAKDGRPNGLPSWKMNRDIAAKLIEQANRKNNKFVIDYEHQTIESARNGRPAPAAGWFKQLVWKEGLGLFAVGVEWTEKAKQFIRNQEYRYISPVFSYNPTTGVIETLRHAALVNTPALDGLRDVSELMAARFQPATTRALSPAETSLLARLGIEESDYLKTELDSQNASSSAAITALKVQEGLTASELTICRQMGIEPADYCATKNG